MKRITAALILALSLVTIEAWSQTVTPQLTAEQKLAYFKARAEAAEAASAAQQASQVAQQKREAQQKAERAIADACGKDAIAQLDAAGMPVCVVKAVEKK